jgi:hypothetical protein
MFDNEEDFLLYAAKHYYNPRGNNQEDFLEDLNRITYIKRLISRYSESNKISHRLLMNHIIIFGNAFTIPAALKMFESKLNEKCWGIIKPFLIELRYIRSTDYPEITSDPLIVELLENNREHNQKIR